MSVTWLPAIRPRTGTDREVLPPLILKTEANPKGLPVRMDVAIRTEPEALTHFKISQP